MKCSVCFIETDTIYFDKCEKCYSFEIFQEHKPTLQEIDNAFNPGLCPCHKCAFPWAPGTKTHKCLRCEFIKKYWKVYQKIKSKKIE